MSKLHRRITTQASAHLQAMGEYHPWGTADTPAVMPAHNTTWTPVGAVFEQLHVIIAADGSPIYAGGRYNPVGVYPAGRP